MKNLLKTSALAAVLAISASAAKATTDGFHTAEDIDITLEFVTALDINMNASIAIDNMVSGDSLTLEEVIFLTRDAGRSTTCVVDDQDSTSSVSSSGVITFDATVDTSRTSLVGSADISDDTACGTLTVALTALQTQVAIEGEKYEAKILIDAAYDTLAAGTFALTAKVTSGVTIYDTARTVAFDSTSSHGVAPSLTYGAISYNDGSGNSYAGWDDTTYTTEDQGSVITGTFAESVEIN
jgi:hypothetical protein